MAWGKTTRILRRAALVAIALASLAAPGAWSATAASGLQSSAKLSQRLRASGRAEVTLRYTLAATPGGKDREVSGALALEPPDRVRLDVSSTGERLVASAEGGAWLQPATKQLLRFGPQQAAPALRWWRVLLGAGDGVRERRVAADHYVLVLTERTGVADSAAVWLDPAGLPKRLVVGGGEDALEYRLAGWRFMHARGASAFRLTAPAGYETVDLP